MLPTEQRREIGYAVVRNFIPQATEKMSAENYAFKPAPKVRTPSSAI
jgi:hypothetical protein